MDRVNYQLNPALIVLDSDGDGVVQIETSTRRPRYAVHDGRLLRVLHSFGSLPASPVAAFESLLGREMGSEVTIQELINHEILTPAGGGQLDVQLPAATHQFHFGTRNHPFLYMRSLDAIVRDNARMKEYEREAPPPPARLVLDYVEEVALTSLNGDVPACSGESPAQALLGVGSALHDQVSVLLDGTFGIRAVHAERWDEWADGTKMYQYETLSKAVPSGGGMHPTECFGVARGGEGEECFAFHYCAPHNSIGVLRQRSPGTDPQPSRARDLELVVVSRLERAMWRYRDSRSARAVILDAGHVLGLLAQLCSALDLTLEVTTEVDEDEATGLYGLPPLFVPMFAARISCPGRGWGNASGNASAGSL